MAIISAFPGKSKPKLQSKTIHPLYAQFDVTPDSGYVGLAKVTIAPQSQVKYVTPSTTQKTVTPDSNKLLSSVVVNAIETQTKGVSPTINEQIIKPDSGKYLTQVTVGGAIGGYYTLSDTYNTDSTKLEFSVPVVDGRNPAIIALYSNGHEGTTKQILSAMLTKRDGNSIYDAVCWVNMGSNSFDEKVITQISIAYRLTTKKAIITLPSTTACVFGGTSLGNQYAVVMTYNDIQGG